MKQVFAAIGLIAVSMAVATCAPAGTSNVADVALANARAALEESQRLEQRIDELEDRIEPPPAE